MLMSRDMEAELVRVLEYARFGLSPEEIMPLLKNIRANAESVRTQSKIEVVSADPTDNVFLGCTIDGKADYIISGDRHLLELGNYEGIPIVKASDFFAREGLVPD